jgi:hypothetical protein
MSTAEELLTSMSGEVKSLSDDAQKKFSEIQARMLLLEQKSDVSRFVGDSHEESPGEVVTKSEEYKSFLSRRSGSTGNIRVKLFDAKTALINATGQNQPLVSAFRREGIIVPGQRRLTVRDLLSQVPVSTNAIEWVEETSFTNKRGTAIQCRPV